MKMLKLATALLAVMLTPAHAVEVIGRGETYEQAKQDGVRLALQRSLKQYVRARRVVINDQVALDEVLTMMNGFVERVEIIEVVNTRPYEIRMDVDVSESRVENFIQTESVRVTFDAQALRADVEVQQERSQTRAEMIRDFYQRMPKEGFNTEVTAVRNDGNFLVVEGKITPSMPFFVSFVNLLTSIADGTVSYCRQLSRGEILNEAGALGLQRVCGTGIDDIDAWVVCVEMVEPSTRRLSIDHYPNGYAQNGKMITGECRTFESLDPVVIGRNSLGRAVAWPMLVVRLYDNADRETNCIVAGHIEELGYHNNQGRIAWSGNGLEIFRLMSSEMEARIPLSSVPQGTERVSIEVGVAVDPYGRDLPDYADPVRGCQTR